MLGDDLEIPDDWPRVRVRVVITNADNAALEPAVNAEYVLAFQPVLNNFVAESDAIPNKIFTGASKGQAVSSFGRWLFGGRP